MFARSRFVFATCLSILACGSLAQAQNTRTWTGLAAPDSAWTTVGNWNGAVPVSGDTARFNSGGNGNVNISLGGTTQPIRNILFDAGAAGYTIGSPGSTDTLGFDAGGAITVNSGSVAAQLIRASILANGLLNITNSSNGLSALSIAAPITLNNGGTLTVTHTGTMGVTQLGGTIGNAAGQPGGLALVATALGATNSNNFILYGANSYDGPTNITVNTGSNGSIQIGNDNAFGKGTVTVNLVAGASAPQFSVLDGTHALANPFRLNSGMTYVGSQSLILSGPLTIINSAAGGTRTLNNAIATAGKSVMLGDSPGSSTITLGNPVANGGDGIGKSLIFNPFPGSTTIINDVMQDPAAGGGVASGSVQYGGSTAGTLEINSSSTYTGGTLFNGFSTIRFNQDFVAGGTAGPFGTGTITLNNTNNNIVQPMGGSRTIANPISMVFGLTVANAAGDTSSNLTLAGPITLPTNGRTITNSLVGGPLTLGSAANPSTISLPIASGQTMSIGGAGTTIINSKIQNPTPAPATPTVVNISATGTVAMNGLNTYSGETTLTGAGVTVRIGSSSNNVPGPSFTAGPFGTGMVTTNNSTPVVLQPFGADRTVANAISMPFGFVVSHPSAAQDPTGPHNLTLSGPMTLGATGRTITNNLGAGTALTLGASGSPSTISLGSTLSLRTQIAGGGNTIINHVVTGTGGLTVQDSAVVQLNSASNYSGATLVTGTGSPKLLVNGSKTGTGSVTIDAVGTLGGTGSVSGTVDNFGKIAPGTSIGTLTTTGNVNFFNNSRLQIELSGSSADKLAVGGNLNLSSTDFLDISGPGSGLSWVIATYGGTLTGTFNNVTSGFTVNYGTGTNSQITLNKVVAAVAGDFNQDGVVDAADYLVWRERNGTASALPNDNGLGVPVTVAHYNLWRSNFGKPPGSGGSLGDTSTVPEPATMLLVLLGVVGMMAARGWRPTAILVR